MNMKMKNVLLAVLLVAVLTVLVAGAAFAGGGKRQGGYRGGRMWGAGYGGGACCMPYGGRGYGYGPYGGRMNADRTNVPEIPQEIREKFAEAQKTAIDLRTELGKNPIDREKALELHAKHRALMNEISEWRFKQRLDALIAR